MLLRLPQGELMAKRRSTYIPTDTDIQRVVSFWQGVLCGTLFISGLIVLTSFITNH